MELPIQKCRRSLQECADPLCTVGTGRRVPRVGNTDCRQTAAAGQHWTGLHRLSSLLSCLHFTTTKYYSILELFKFCSLSGFLICRSGDHIALKSICQNQTALRSCEAEIMATNKCATEIQSIKHRAHDIGIPEAYSCTKIYNDNKVAVQWAASVTSQVIKHLNLKETMVRECHQSKDVDVKHIP